MKTLNWIVTAFAKIFYYFIILFTSLFLMLLVSIFVFIVFVQANPMGAEVTITNGLHKVLPIFKINAKDIRTHVKQRDISIDIQSFERSIKNGKLIGNGVKIVFSLDDILNGRIYKITIKDFKVNVFTNSVDTKDTFRPTMTRLYSLIPPFKMKIDNFALSIDDNVIYLKNSLLLLNQNEYILLISTSSKNESYKINVMLSPKTLNVAFNNVPEKVFHTYTGNKFKFIHFRRISGKIIMNTHNFVDLKYFATFDNLSIEKTQHIRQNLFFVDSVSISGFASKGIYGLSSNFNILDSGSVSLDIKLGKETQDILINAENFSIQRLKDLVPHSIINKTKFAKLTNYLTGASSVGLVKSAIVDLHLPVTKANDVLVQINFQDTSFEYDKNFTAVHHGYGSVNVNADRTIVLLNRGLCAGNQLGFSKVEIRNHDIDVDFTLKGTPLSAGNILFPDKDLSKYKHIVTGDITMKGQIKLDLLCNDILQCSSFSGLATMHNIESFLNKSKNADGTLQISKKKNKDIESLINFVGFQNRYTTLKRVNLTTKITNKNISFSGNAYDAKDKEIAKVNYIKFNFAKKFNIDSFDIPKIDVKDSKISIDFIKNFWNLNGDSLNMEMVRDLLSRVHGDKELEQLHTKNSLSKKIKTNVHINNVKLYNGISTPLHLQSHIDNGEMKYMFLDTNILSFHYFLPNIKTTSQQKQLGMFLSIPSFANLSTSLGNNDGIHSGSLYIKGARIDDSIIWEGYVNDLKVNSQKINFHPKNFNIVTIFKNHILSFDNIKIQDRYHTVFFTGEVFTRSLLVDGKIFYTPSKIEFLNEIPLLRDAFKITTLGSSKKGLMSFEIDVNGFVFDPNIKFNKYSSVKSVSKFGVGVLLFPLLLL